MGLFLLLVPLLLISLRDAASGPRYRCWAVYDENSTFTGALQFHSPHDVARRLMNFCRAFVRNYGEDSASDVRLERLDYNSRGFEERLFDERGESGRRCVVG